MSPRACAAFTSPRWLTPGKVPQQLARVGIDLLGQQAEARGVTSAANLGGPVEIGPEGVKWAALCEDHGWVAWLTNRRDAQGIATMPKEFCADCAADEVVVFVPEFPAEA